MVQLKICGFADIADVKAVCEVSSGIIWAFGFIFCPTSKRKWEDFEHLTEALDIAKSAGIKTVAVFKDNTLEELEMGVKYGFDYLQMYDWGKYEDFVNTHKSRIILSFKASEYTSGNSADLAVFPYHLIDGDNPGSGEELNLNGITSQSGTQIILAGGVNPDNITNFLQFKPFAIDVATGSEKSYGVKDLDKINRMVGILGYDFGG